MGRVGLENYTFKKTGDGAPKGESRKKNGLGHLEELLKVIEDPWYAPMLFDLV